MELTRKNYHSKEASLKYAGSTQISRFIECEAKFLAILNGDWKEEKDVFLQGNYIDAYFDGELEEFKKEHPELFTIKGDRLLKKFEDIEIAIKSVENDPVMHNLFNGGECQVIMTGTIEGVEFKIMIDSLLVDRIVDRKFMRDFEERWSDKHDSVVPWWRTHDYDRQAAIYKEIAKQNGIDLPFEVCAISKEEVPDKSWIRFSQETLDLKMEELKHILPRFQAVKTGMFEPDPCGECDFCRSRKMLKEYEEV